MTVIFKWFLAGQYFKLSDVNLPQVISYGILRSFVAKSRVEALSDENYCIDGAQVRALNFIGFLGPILSCGYFELSD